MLCFLARACVASVNQTEVIIVALFAPISHNMRAELWKLFVEQLTALSSELLG